MSGHTPFREIVGEVTPERRARIDRLKEQYRAEMALEELRGALHLTQRAVAKRLKMNQASVSKLEGRTDLLLSTLAKYIAALGGRLEVVAHLPIGTVSLKGLGELRKTRAGQRPA